MSESQRPEGASREWPYHLLKHGANRGGARTKEYRAWTHIKGRCLKPTDGGYRWYGARGITMHPEWAESFEAFLAGVGHAPSPDHSIDRIDNDGPYAPGNVRWATKSEQARNTRRTVMFEGVPLKDFCEQNGLGYGAVRARLRRGDPSHIAISPLTGGAYRAALKGCAK